MKTEDKAMLKNFEEIPGPKGLPLVGTLFDYFKKDGLSFDKMFEVMYLEPRKKIFSGFVKSKHQESNQQLFKSL